MNNCGDFQGIKPSSWYEALHNVSSLLENCGVEYFADSGTLLGLIRDGDFIAWDNDIDIGLVYEPSTYDLLLKVLKKNYGAVLVTKYSLYVTVFGVEVGINIYTQSHKGFSTYYWVNNASGLISNLVMGLALTKNGVIRERAYVGWIGRLKNALIYGAALICPGFLAKKYMRRYWCLRESRLEVGLLGQFCKFECRGVSTCVPSNSADYLLAKYGVDWRRPKREYDYIKDDETLIRDR